MHITAGKDRKLDISTRDIQVDISPVILSKSQTGSKRGRSLQKTQGLEAKRRKTSKQSAGRSQAIKATTVCFDTNGSTLALNTSKTGAKSVKEGGIPEIQKFKCFSDTDIFGDYFSKKQEIHEDSEDDCDTDQEEIDRVKKLCLRRLRAQVDRQKH
jgi:hypothetical protein